MARSARSSRSASLLPVAAALLVLGGLGLVWFLGAGSDREPDPDVQVSPTELRCLEVGPDLVDALQESVSRSGTGEIAGVGAVRAEELEDGFFVAARVTVPGTDEIGVWFVDDVTDPGVLRSVDEVASRVSGRPSACDSIAAACASDRGARAARACLP